MGATAPTPCRRCAGPERIEGLDDSLARIGVPALVSTRRSPRPPSTDWRALLATLPVAPTAPTDGGSVIVVVGAGDGTRRRRPGPSWPSSAWARPICSPWIGPTRAGRRWHRRRSSNKVTVLVVEASLRSRDLAAAASWIEQVKPDYVLGAVAATAKRADVEHWRAQVGRLDALALSRLGRHRVAGRADGTPPDRLSRRRRGFHPAVGPHAAPDDAGAPAVKRREYHALAADVRRFRPVVVIVLTVIVLSPTLDEMVTQSLSPLTVLARLAVSLAVVGALVWAVSAVVLHYARIQVESARRGDQESGIRASDPSIQRRLGDVSSHSGYRRPLRPAGRGTRS